MKISEQIVENIEQFKSVNEQIDEQKGERSLRDKFCIMNNILNFET
ncbi:hypothetical protein [Okeania sp. SIO1I7]|nr:hypothetical protein [Okeania sp. SIO1I7]NET28089.1 hypothetical protein [Okeania sp. SIO1I7]